MGEKDQAGMLMSDYPGAPLGPTTFITFSGIRVDPFDLKPEHVRIEDIAHSLSMQCRFTGHVREFYSVAEHSVRCSWMVPKEHRLWALLHDAAEAYCADMIRPIKNAPGFEPYKAMEAAIERVIVQVFELPMPRPACIKVADERMLLTERRDLKGVNLAPPKCQEEEPAEKRILPWRWQLAKIQFLRRYLVLTDPLNPEISRMGRIG